MRLRDDARTAWEAGLQSVRADDAARRALTPLAGELPDDAVVLGWGKAALAMLDGVLAVRPRARGVVVVKAERTNETHRGDVKILYAAHPVPDASSEAAGRALLASAASLGSDDFAIFLSSGGGSSLLATPLPGGSMHELARTWRELVRSGAPISECNAVRASMSAAHGGRLLEAAGSARTLTLVVSDVPGDDPALVASGPSIPSRGAAADASRHRVRVVARNADAVAAAAATLRARGYVVDERRDAVQGDAAVVGAALARDLLARPGRAAIVSGGETTVRIEGERPGGRNLHLAAHAARVLGSSPRRAVIASIATDGEDGSSGSAGALVDERTSGRWRGVDAQRLLAECDALALLRASDDLVHVDDTHTNVMDLHVALAEEG